VLTFDEVWENIKMLVQQLPVITLNDIIEIIVIAFVIYQIVKWVRGTRAWMLVKGLVFLFLVAAIAVVFELNTILWLFANTINVGIIAVLIVFQPELRRALEQLGRKNLFSQFNVFDEQKERNERISTEAISILINAVEDMGKSKTGALIVIEQDIKLDEYERTGIPIDAVITNQLLNNIFEHNTPLHDGAVIIRNNRIVAATCYLPLSDNMSLSKELGTRHRAGVGITEVTDAMVIIVSEETGKISLAMSGNLIRDVDGDYLKNKLVYAQRKVVDVRKFKIWKGRHKNDRKNNK